LFYYIKSKDNENLASDTKFFKIASLQLYISRSAVIIFLVRLIDIIYIDIQIFAAIINNPELIPQKSGFLRNQFRACRTIAGRGCSWLWSSRYNRPSIFIEGLIVR